MLGFKRFMAYLYEYENGEKQQNCGFAKVTVRNEEGIVELHIRQPAKQNPITYQVYLYYRKEKSSSMYGILTGEIMVKGGSGEGTLRFLAVNLGNENREFTDMSGIYLKAQGDVIATEWDDKPVTPSSFVVEGTKEDGQSDGSREQEEMVVEVQPIVEAQTESKLKEEKEQAETEVTEENEEKKETEEIKEIKETEQVQNQEEIDKKQKESLQAQSVTEREKPVEKISAVFDKWSQLKEKYPVVSPFDEKEDITCIRIQPKDICLLNRKEWILGNNNFLLHGYCNYRYLMLGKIESTGTYIICVPGNYYSKEKMMASMFGFTGFKMAGSGILRQGEFGYWYRDISL